MLIGLNGKLKSGKDTTFDLISELYPFAERISFAEKLKESASSTLGMSRELVDNLKNHENIHISIAGTTSLNSLLPSDLAGEATKWSITMREYLQKTGTEGHRDIFGQDFWVDMALPLDTDHKNRLLIVTDMRFPNEIQRVKDLDGVCVKVNRDVETQFSAHASEQNLDHMIDYVLDNTGNISDLRNQVRAMFGVLRTTTSENPFLNIDHVMWAWEKVNVI